MKIAVLTATAQQQQVFQIAIRKFQSRIVILEFN